MKGFILAVSMVLLCTTILLAQGDDSLSHDSASNQGAVPKLSSPIPTPPITAFSPSPPGVDSVWRPYGTEHDSAGLGDIIRVKLSREVSGQEGASLLLFLNGIPMDGITGHGSGSTIYFRLQRTEENDSVWDYIYRRNPATCRVEVAVGSLKSTPGVSKPDAFTLVLVQSGHRVWAWLAVAAIIVGFLLLAFQSNVLRDDNGVLAPGGDPRPHKRMAPYSLARVQLAFWTILIGCGYIFIALSTGAAPSLLESTLTLLGISVATTAVARTIDATKEATASAVGGTIVIPHTDNFIIDILSDSNGVNIQRFQFLVWTLIFGVLFVVHLFSCYSFLDLSTTQLILVGIGSATYAGLKLSEDPQAIAVNAMGTLISR